MTTITYANQATATNDTTPVTILSAPASSHIRIAKPINIYNADTSSVTITVNLVKSGTPYPLFVQTILTGETYVYTPPVILGATTDSLTAVLGGAVSTTQPKVVVNYVDIS